MSAHIRIGTFRIAAAVLAAATYIPGASAISLDEVIAGPHRDPVNVARDAYRHPKETLAFFGLDPAMTVVEVWPARGWYTEILAPVLRDKGAYYAAGFVIDQSSNEYQRGIQDGYVAKLKGSPDLYGKVQLTELGAGRTEIAPAGAADLVLTFRNVHNWMKAGFVDEVLAAFFRALKPGGVLGVVEHRAKAGTSVEKMIESGYVTEEHVIALAKKAGFVLEERSEINANPADTTDHPRGVWTLSPGYALCREVEAGPKQDECRAPWKAIGESDRMTLRFRKPA